MAFPATHSLQIIATILPVTCDHLTISSALEIIATKICVDFHSYYQRAVGSQLDHYFRDVDIREIALSSRAEAAGTDDRRDRGH